MGADYKPGKGMFEYQAPAVLNQAGPNINQWYDILPETENVRIYRIGCGVLLANETLAVQILIDGQVIDGVGFVCAFGVDHYAYMYSAGIGRTDNIYLSNVVADEMHKAFMIEGRVVQVQMRKTTANGAGNLSGIVMYGQLS